MRRIAIEEHFTMHEHLDCLRSILENKYPVPEVIQEEKTLQWEVSWLPASDRLLDVGEGRLRQMDEAGIDMQVLSLVQPGIQVLDASTGNMLAKKINDELSKIVARNPKRFAGLASLAPQNPREAAYELKRAVTELGLRGASINSHVKGEYLDDRKYWVIFEMAQELGVPIYIHPRVPSPDMVKPYLAYPGLASAVCGFGAETSLHALRLIFSGVFDEYPKLKIILGHLGEALPFWLGRIDASWQRRPNTKKLIKQPSEYFKDNFFVTTSGVFWQSALLCSYLALGADRILLATDYPFGSSKQAVSFIQSAPICDSDKEKIYHLNAERLLML